MKIFNMSLSKKKLLLGWIFVLPVLIVRLTTTLYPILATVWYSFLDFDLMKKTKEFAGLYNFIELTHDAEFKQSFEFTAKFVIISMIFIVVLGLGLALLLKCNFAGRKIIRTVSLIPWGMAMIVLSIAGTWIFNDTYGIVNDLIRRCFSPEFQYGWLSNSKGAQISVIIVNVWKNTSFFAILMLSAFQGVPIELYESAKVDGLNDIGIFFKITMPYVKRTFIMMIMFVGIIQINSFEVVYGMSKGGPGSTTSLLAYKVYTEATKSLNYGAAAAITMVMFAFTAIFGAVGLSLYRKVDY